MIGTYGWIVYSQMYSNDCGDGRVGRGETGCCGSVLARRPSCVGVGD